MNLVRSITIPTLLTMLVLAACNPSPAGITVIDAWARPSPVVEMESMEGMNGGVYLTIRNDGDQADRLLGAESPVARVVEIHETTMEGDVMAMRPVEAIEIPAGGEVSLEPGGYHIMLIDLQQPLAAGDSVELTLIFEQAGRITVTAEVRE